jgi:hypothetical protein
MWRLLAGSFLLLAASAQPSSAKPILLIVGAPHFANPGRDVVNVRVPEVLSLERQREIEAVVARLAAFRPTRVAIEWDADEQARLDQRYADYRAGRYSLSANEVDQLGLRLAARLGLARVDAVDWGEEPPGGWSSYDYPAWAEANGRGEEWRAWVRQQEEEGNAGVRLMACTPVSAWLRRFNTREYRASDHRNYYRIAQVGSLVGPNPGAAWVGTWYTRNLRILNNLRAIAPKPDDRVVAIFGAGHGYLLDQQARESGAFDVTDTLAHLPNSPQDQWTQCPNGH